MEAFFTSYLICYMVLNKCLFSPWPEIYNTGPTFYDRRPFWVKINFTSVLIVWLIIVIWQTACISFLPTIGVFLLVILSLNTELQPTLATPMREERSVGRSRAVPNSLARRAGVGVVRAAGMSHINICQGNCNQTCAYSNCEIWENLHIVKIGRLN